LWPKSVVICGLRVTAIPENRATLSKADFRHRTAFKHSYHVSEYFMRALESVMRVFGTALASGLLIGAGMSGAALAADMEMTRKAEMAVKAQPLPISSWTGLYGGVNGGAAFGNTTGTLTTFAPMVANGATPQANLGAKHDGGFGGVQLGFNWQTGGFVYGVETDIQGADIGRTATTTTAGTANLLPRASTGRDHIDWFGTVRGRAGIALDQVLFFGTAGLAYGGVHTSASSIVLPAGAGGVFTGTTANTRVGWAAGAGVEWGFAPGWSVKGEYLHVDLGSSNVTILDPVNFPNASATYRFNHAFDSIRVGVNYKFDWVVAPMMAAN
jgi:outer membrane immunogenic protein